MATGSMAPNLVDANGGELTEEMIEAAKAELRETDGEPLESDWHRAAINLLIESVIWHRRGRTDYFVGGNMFIYYSRTQSRTWEYKGPDFFFVDGVDGTRERRFWWVFEEGNRFPDTIMELLSPTTARTDRTTKKEIYERIFRTPDYFLYDPDSQQLEGWRLGGKNYQAILPNDKGWLWSEELGLWVGLLEGTYLGRRATWVRFFDREGNLVLTEAEARKQEAEAQTKRAEREKQRADTEMKRADLLAAELARAQALLKEKSIAPEQQ